MTKLRRHAARNEIRETEAILNQRVVVPDLELDTGIDLITKAFAAKKRKSNTVPAPKSRTEKGLSAALTTLVALIVFVCGMTVWSFTRIKNAPDGPSREYYQKLTYVLIMFVIALATALCTSVFGISITFDPTFRSA